MKFWPSALTSAVAHALILCIPVSMTLNNVSLETPCEEFQFVVLQSEESQGGRMLPEPGVPIPPAAQQQPFAPQEADLSEEIPEPQKTPPRMDTPEVEKTPPLQEKKPSPITIARKTPPPKPKPQKEVQKPPVKAVRRQEPREVASTASTQTPEPSAAPSAQKSGSEEALPKESPVDTAGTGNSPKSDSGSSAGNGPIQVPFGSGDGPRFVQRVLPKYPRLARELGKEGRVVLQLTIDENGRLAHVEVVSKAGSGFDEEAVRAVKSSTFLPAKRNGKPITSIARLPIRFQLRSSNDD
ncbi:energy transducer TonB [Desulforhabdus amnigena]|jgi:protein TonB|uniref:TonB C-terminal domain-containing protein n=1 Tax=Desulforhabdus amnigena TaxID=40218 RepID=A0A9W6L9U4_9BACT|nr:energy transducer TonB [Desulforhabdus amnigena]NLJ28486.1 energy transducer TonB [Deltaproteobacteria bacterium]GLI35371.1 hypothetical protein DAMNIGENAA_28040 [Desulforhabdus amnigena]